MMDNLLSLILKGQLIQPVSQFQLPPGLLQGWVQSPLEDQILNTGPTLPGDPILDHTETKGLVILHIKCHWEHLISLIGAGVLGGVGLI